MEAKEVVIINADRDFCLLMQYYLQKRNCTVEYVSNIQDGLLLIDSMLPQIIIADNNVAVDMQEILHEKIESIAGYAPNIYLINSNAYPQGRDQDEGTLLDDIKKWFQSLKKTFN
jgi:DNA-binding NtrC family response regulator